ncbi:Gfo/Idh/MocA family protein [Pseudarthrobacter sp. NamB4]|uniref:Gfo/Idh/MocA family protein n=1 Tax=Pseudarthrobacter sp. NamB4 TaxID=2576837 RepID=UPI0010FF13C0|nr:Gfo/Idh/MocA family oxidoreductase [Pseudarthrobacter sp. NamB4]TLM70525.1 Gfo/Idh/MocA family oxidoreductase [Pseudarthrobacter sp. NamB4]
MLDTHPLRLAFVGVTHPHAHAWATAAHEHDDAVISGVFDPDPDAARRFANQYSAQVIGLEDLGPGKHDAAVIDGRNDQARWLSLAAVGAGLPLFIEKTGGMNAAELQEVANKSAAAGLATQMGYFLRYSDAVAQAQNVLSSGSLGTLTLARFHCAIPDQAWSTMGHWFSDPGNVVGGFMEAGCHMVDIVRHLLGQPTAVTARASSGHGINHAESSLAACLEYEGHIASLDFTAHEANTWNENWSIELHGTAATFKAGLTPAWAQVNHGTYLSSDLLNPLPFTEEERAESARQENALFMRRGMNLFVRTLRGRAAPAVDAADGASTLRLIEEIYASAAADTTPSLSRSTPVLNR